MASVAALTPDILQSTAALPAHLAGQFREATLQFHGAGVLQPNSLFFTTNDRILVTPGLLEFAVQ